MVGRYPLNEVANVRNILLQIRETFSLKKYKLCRGVYARIKILMFLGTSALILINRQNHLPLTKLWQNNYIETYLWCENSVDRVEIQTFPRDEMPLISTIPVIVQARAKHPTNSHLIAPGSPILPVSCRTSLLNWCKKKTDMFNQCPSKEWSAPELFIHGGAFFNHFWGITTAYGILFFSQ